MPTTRPYNWTATLPVEDVLAELVLDWRAPLSPGADLLRATDGRCYIYERDRWGADPVIREVVRFAADFPHLQDYPSPSDDWDCPATAAGEVVC